MAEGKGSGSRTAVVAALVGNLLVFATKASAAAATGSAAMLSEAVHSFVDTGNEVLLLYGMRRSKRRAARDHPAGYGRELYFWSVVVALLMFSLGAGVSIFQGLNRSFRPQPIEHPLVHYEWIRMPDSSGFGSYTESGMVIPCRFRGQDVNFVAQM